MAITSILLAMQFGLDFEVVEMDFADVDDAIDWLRKNQLGKRNLTENQQVFLAGDLYNRSRDCMEELGKVRDQVFMMST